MLENIVTLITRGSKLPPEILELQDWIGACAFRVAPSKSQDLNEMVKKLESSIEFTDDRGFDIRVNLVSNEIKLPIAALNYLWCSTYLFLILYNKYVEAQHAGGAQLDTGGSPELDEAISLWNWSSGALLTDELCFPPHGPRPSKAYEHADNIHTTNELFLCALAWIIHHEMAHLYLAHSSAQASASVRQETEADLAATRWIMEGCKDELERQKRAFGVVIATMSMVLMDSPHMQRPEVTSHPPAIERLFDNLDVAALPDENIVYSFSAVALQFAIAQFSVAKAIYNDEGNSLKGMYEHFLRIYALRHRD